MLHILIVGQKFSTLTDYLLDHGYEYTFLQDISKTKFPDKRFKRRVVANFSNKETLLSALSQIEKPVDGVLATYENYILPTAWIAEYYGLPGIQVAAAEACTDKSKMRQLFSLASEKISPAFSTVTDEQSLLKFADAHAYPLILKPANLSKSLLVTKNSTRNELIANYHRSTELLATTYKKYAPNRAPKLIVEEFLEGSIHSVDAFVDKDGSPQVLENIVDYQTGYDIGYDDNFHYSRILPSKLSASDQVALRHCAEVGIRALGMKNSPAHVEIIMTNQGPRIVEIGARNGGYRERMHGLANGIDITGAAVSLALGREPTVKPLRNDSCAVLELFPRAPGLFQTISNIETAKKLPSLVYLSIKAKENVFIGKSSDGYKMTGVIILHNSDKHQFKKDLSYIDSRVHVITY